MPPALPLVALVAALATTPALGWDYVEQPMGESTLIGAWEDDGSGYQLAVECDTSSPEPDLYLFTPEAYISLDMLDDGVPVTVSVDGAPAGPVFGVQEVVRGNIAIGVHAADERRLGPVFQRLRQAGTSIEVGYGDLRLRFGIDRVGWVMATLLSRCRALDPTQ